MQKIILASLTILPETPTTAAACSRALALLLIGGKFATECFAGLPTVSPYRFFASAANIGSISTATAALSHLLE